MATGRIRTLKPETLEDERPAGLSDSAWRLWVSLMLLADDHGNTRAAPSWLTAQVWWAHKRPPNVAALLSDLVKAKSIALYHVRGQLYAHLSGWERHQRIDNAGRPKVPPPSEAEEDSPRVAEILREPPQASEVCRSDLDLDLEMDRDRDLKRLEQRPEQLALEPTPVQPLARPVFDFESAYKRYPRKLGKRAGLAKCKTQIKTPERFEAFGRAVDNYAASVADTAPQYVKHFASFMACWEDYTEGVPESRKAPPSPRPAIPESEGGFSKL